MLQIDRQLGIQDYRGTVITDCACLCGAARGGETVLSLDVVKAVGVIPGIGKLMVSLDHVLFDLGPYEIKEFGAPLHIFHLFPIELEERFRAPQSPRPDTQTSLEDTEAREPPIVSSSASQPPQPSPRRNPQSPSRNAWNNQQGLLVPHDQSQQGIHVTLSFPPMFLMRLFNIRCELGSIDQPAATPGHDRCLTTSTAYSVNFTKYFGIPQCFCC